MLTGSPLKLSSSAPLLLFCWYGSSSGSSTAPDVTRMRVLLEVLSVELEGSTPPPNESVVSMDSSGWRGLLGPGDWLAESLLDPGDWLTESLLDPGDWLAESLLEPCDWLAESLLDPCDWLGESLLDPLVGVLTLFFVRLFMFEGPEPPEDTQK